MKKPLSSNPIAAAQSQSICQIHVKTNQQKIINATRNHKTYAIYFEDDDIHYQSKKSDLVDFDYLDCRLEVRTSKL